MSKFKKVRNSCGNSNGTCGSVKKYALPYGLFLLPKSNVRSSRLPGRKSVSSIGKIGQ